MDKAEERLREEFNSWAEAGRGTGLEQNHIDVTLQIIDQMPLKPTDRVLDLGCGTGWATRLLGMRVPKGEAIGIDISDAMIARAAASANNPLNVRFEVTHARKLPFPDKYFHHALSIESLYYYPDMLAALKELARVLEVGGQFYAMVNLYEENQASHSWVDKLAVPVHLLSAADYCMHFEAAGFGNVRDFRVHDRRAIEELQDTSGFSTTEQAKQSAEAGSLVIVGTKMSE
jgi:ubiquinone/menaquinone biosynthesis C-methylase UbiE